MSENNVISFKIKDLNQSNTNKSEYFIIKLSALFAFITAIFMGMLLLSSSTGFISTILLLVLIINISAISFGVSYWVLTNHVTVK